MGKLERNKKVCRRKSRRRREFPKLFFLDNLVVNFYHLSVAIEQDVFHDSEVFLPTIFMGGDQVEFLRQLDGRCKISFSSFSVIPENSRFFSFEASFCWSRWILKNARMTLKLETPDLWDIKPCGGVLKASYLDHTRTKCVWCSVIAESRTPIKEEAPKWTMEKEAQDIFFFKGSLLPPYNLYKKFHGMRFHIKSHFVFSWVARVKIRSGHYLNFYPAL